MKGLPYLKTRKIRVWIWKPLPPTQVGSETGQSEHENGEWQEVTKEEMLKYGTWAITGE